MVGKAETRRDDDHGPDGGQSVEALIACLNDIIVKAEVDKPGNATGEWWIDLSFDGYGTNVAWRPDRGFGIFTSDEDAYGDRPDEVYREPTMAARRIRQLARREPEDQAPMRLSEMRKLCDQPQRAIADRLRKDQGFVSRLERRGDALVSTVRDYVEALGGEMRLVVRFGSFEAPVSLPKETGRCASLKRAAKVARSKAARRD